MTIEAVFSKLFYLFQLLGNENLELIKEFFTSNVTGELSDEPFNIKTLNNLTDYF